MSAWKILFFFSVLYGLAMVVFTLGQELLSFTSPKKLKDTWVKAKVKSQVIIHCISLPSESWNDSGKVSISLKTILITDVANLRFLELWGRGTSSLIQPTTTKYIFCLEVSKRIPPAVITPACMIAKDKNMNPQRICMTLSHSIVRDTTHQCLCRSPIIDAILATRNRL